MMPDREGVQPVKGGPSEAVRIGQSRAQAEFEARIRADQTRRIVEWTRDCAQSARDDYADNLAARWEAFARLIDREFGATTHAE